ncbi:aminotransferase class I/II-fold pyridoxal phosphate-dependent enzyme [Eubacteriales bacterium OttesenSCG-928-K08]|nr:aminotransferase class I/II-fold pyridoxal phosphate-dependent enzyme [Eubacteriales bacterium OttesenSCG-928-K08]
MSEKINFNTILNHNGNTIKGVDKGVPKVAPIVMSAAYSFSHPQDLFASLKHEIPDYDYGREGNATNDCANEILCALDGGAVAQVYATGMASICMTVMAQIKAGDHIILSSIVFGGTFNLIVNKLMKRYGVEVTVVDLNDPDWEKNFKPNTKMVYMETISNPMIEVLDMQKIADVTHAHNAVLVVDNTFATPIVCRPLSLGADFVVYSGTKYMNGHSDIMAGVVVGKDEKIMKDIISEGHVFGPTMSPFDAFLFARGLRTLELRMRQHSSNAMKLAEYLSKHPKVKEVRYPGLASNPYHEVAKKQFNGIYGGMVSIDLGTFENVISCMEYFKFIKLVPSLGCLTTTYSDTRTSHGGMSAEDRAKCGIGDSIMRVSVGLEDIDDIIAEFERGFAKL